MSMRSWDGLIVPGALILAGVGVWLAVAGHALVALVVLGVCLAAAVWGCWDVHVRLRRVVEEQRRLFGDDL